MTLRFSRVVKVTVGALEVSELHVEFSIEKTLKPEPNTCELTIYNLSRNHQAQLEQLEPKKGDLRGIPVKIEAGYETTGTSLLWLGDLREVYSLRQGPDVLTFVGSGDGERAVAKSQIDQSFGPGTPLDVALRAVADALGVGRGNIAQAVNSLTKEGRAALQAPLAEGFVFSGPTARLMTDWLASAGLTWSIQGGVLQLLNRGSALAEEAILLDSVSGVNTGLLDSPAVDNDGVLTARILMTPDVYPGRLAVVKSRYVEGQFRIERCIYSATNYGGPFDITIEATRY